MNKEELKENLGTVSDDEQTNEAYWTYSSIWLTYYDDSLKHFFWRDYDISPIKDLEDPSDEEIKKAYLDEAVELATEFLLKSSSRTVDEIVNEYPILEERRSELESAAEKIAVM